MEARPLVVTLTGATAVIWGALALVAPKMAIRPLLGFIPISTWDVLLHGPAFQLLLPVAICLCLPATAWGTKSKKLAWCIPAVPVMGAALFYVQIGFGMGRAFT